MLMVVDLEFSLFCASPKHQLPGKTLRGSVGELIGGQQIGSEEKKNGEA
jgi:hypothetical protein